MRKLLWVVFFSVFLASCGGGGNSNSGAGQTSETPAPEPEESQPEESQSGGKQESIVIISDSIGTGATASYDFGSSIQGRTSLTVINRSISGQTTAQGAPQVAGFLQQFDPKFIVVLLGTNDALQNKSASGAVNTLRSMAQLALDNGTIPIIGTLPPIYSSNSANDIAASISGGLFGISGARIARVRQALGPSDMSPDGIHPNNSGQSKIGAVFANNLYD